MNWFYFSSPSTFYGLAGRLAPWFFILAAVFAAFGLYLGLGVAPTDAQQGAVFTALGLITGSLWGKPMWGTYWVWDARLTSELVLLFLYFGYMALANAFEDPRRGDRAAALLALIGVVNLPIIYFSVQWWNTLHQGSSVSFKGTSMHVTMLTGMLVMSISAWMYAIGATLVRVRSVILERERRAQWVRNLPEAAA